MLQEEPGLIAALSTWDTRVTLESSNDLTTWFTCFNTSLIRFPGDVYCSVDHPTSSVTARRYVDRQSPAVRALLLEFLVQVHPSSRFLLPTFLAFLALWSTMLPADPPKLSHRDFDPSTMALDGDTEIRSEVSESGIELSSVEINILIYLVRPSARSIFMICGSPSLPRFVVT